MERRTLWRPRAESGASMPVYEAVFTAFAE